ncbi:hypothetical protein SDC9_98265 [bioreactor metagenome]|uniref:Uncharacterized protein n=1 Tax=bioreactor metagenome TaxID=1076179 RepID=A0A645AEY3_9ZZZZ
MTDPLRRQRSQSRAKHLSGSLVLTCPQLRDSTQRVHASTVVSPARCVRIAEVTENPFGIVGCHPHRDGIADTIRVNGMQGADRQHAHRAPRIGQRVQRCFCQTEESLYGRLIASDGRRHRHSYRQFGIVVGARFRNPCHQTDEDRLVRAQAHRST